MLIVFHLKMHCDPALKTNYARNGANPLVYTVPALLDLIASFLNFTGLILLSASSYSMLRMLCLVFTVLLSATVRRQTYEGYQYTAVALVLLGLTIVGLADVYLVESSSSSTDDLKVAQSKHALLIGYVCMITG